MTQTCARCGKKGSAELFTYSRWTRNRYCRDNQKCERRRTRQRRRAAVA